MPRQPSFDAENFETKVLITTLGSPKPISRREIFDKSGFDNNNKAMVNHFLRWVDQDEIKKLIAQRGDRKNRRYIARNRLTTEDADPKPPKKKHDKPKKKANPPQNTDEAPIPRSQAARRQEPPFRLMPTIKHPRKVTKALETLSQASGSEKLVALGMDTQLPEDTGRFMGFQLPLPCRRMYISAGDLVYQFDIVQIKKELQSISDPYGVGNFDPFRDFFENHTILAHDIVKNCALLRGRDIFPRSLVETRLAVRMIHDQKGVDDVDDSYEATMSLYLRSHLYEADAAKVGSLLLLFRKLRQRLGDTSDTFDDYCKMLPSLAWVYQRPLRLIRSNFIKGEEPELITPSYRASESRRLNRVAELKAADTNEAIIALTKALDSKECEISPTYELFGNGRIKMTPDLSLLPESVKQSIWMGHTVLAVRFNSKPNLLKLLPAFRERDLNPVIILDNELVFRAKEGMPEETAVEVMNIIFAIEKDSRILLSRGDCWGVNNWRDPDRYQHSHHTPDGWGDDWWGSELSTDTVQSVLKT